MKKLILASASPRRREIMEKLNLENSVYVTTPQNTNKVYLFCVGTDGCGTENSQVFEEDYRKWIQPASMVPFQLPNPGCTTMPAGLLMTIRSSSSYTMSSGISSGVILFS